MSSGGAAFSQPVSNNGNSRRKRIMGRENLLKKVLPPHTPPSPKLFNWGVVKGAARNVAALVMDTPSIRNDTEAY
jgi:hypothetical protein